MNDRWELLFELAGTSDTRFDNHYLHARVGFDAAVTESFHVLASVATGLTEPNGENALDYDVFLGIQLFR